MSYLDQTAIIELEKMDFYAYHGCYKEEQVVGNKFVVNISLETNIATPAASDKIQDALNYVEVYNVVKEEMMKTSHLLEHVTRRIIDRLFIDFPAIIHATVKVSKMNPPMGGQMKAVSVLLKR
ncbi:dihydroneopterin aldolase [Alkalitalea saponilacus]|uniref:7,8-dihydroneopterin aldolase n=1 Tax=Alkalitalea saponilacus TaxID=889453 RepID=A0A1T5FRK6_9BACT|nr:dihydroneopterin aldolase [Alkalitalea saponilacus]ASB49474.1 dihydroneopterin aldolase [Alkalitalea saponilacus]SKB98815.1 dihydroneopterin aldolase [Alkalitalea saponilacus]